MIIGGTARSWRPIWPWPLALIPILVAVGAVPVPTALLHTAAFTVVTVIAAAHGTIASRRPQTRTGIH